MASRTGVALTSSSPASLATFSRAPGRSSELRMAPSRMVKTMLLSFSKGFLSSALRTASEQMLLSCMRPDLPVDSSQQIITRSPGKDNRSLSVQKWK